MSQYAVCARSLGKRFRLKTAASIHESIERLFRERRRDSDPSTEEDTDRQEDSLWALRNISFEVKQGEAIGIIGYNGAGKSVLLRILSRITAPTEGEAEVRGHVASLLEVGAGFHAELTGRENVYFNGAILGMRRDTIREKFDEIVRFAEMERFIDVPVRLYSTGMRVRLALSVAAHLEPEILLIDEAMSVGDEAFRLKCSRKIKDFIANGCTVFVADHNPNTITTLCDRVILLERGRMIDEGEPHAVLQRYRERKLA